MEDHGHPLLLMEDTHDSARPFDEERLLELQHIGMNVCSYMPIASGRISPAATLVVHRPRSGLPVHSPRRRHRPLVS